MNHPEALDHTLTEFILKSIDLAQKKEAIFIIFNSIMQCSDAMLYQYILEENDARLKIVFEAATDALNKL